MVCEFRLAWRLLFSFLCFSCACVALHQLPDVLILPLAGRDNANACVGVCRYRIAEMPLPHCCHILVRIRKYLTETNEPEQMLFPCCYPGFVSFPLDTLISGVETCRFFYALVFCMTADGAFSFLFFGCLKESAYLCEPKIDKLLYYYII